MTVYINGVAVVAGAAAADFPMKLKPALTRWVVPGWGSYPGTVNTTLNSGEIYYIPIFVSETTTYIRIGVYVPSGVAGTVDLRIFNWVDGLPTSLVLSAGTVDTTTTGTKEITISQELTRGYYFLTARGNAANILSGFKGVDAVSPPVPGQTNALNNNPEKFILSVNAAYNDPAPAPDDIANMTLGVVRLREN